MARNTPIVLLLVLLVVLSAEAAYSQSSFLKKRQSGIGVLALLESGENHTGLGASLGYSFSARFDLGIVVGRAAFDDEIVGRDGTGLSFSPYATAILIKPSRTSNFGAEASVSYGFTSFSSDYFDALNQDLSETGYTAGGTLYLRLESYPTLEIYPRASIAYVNVRRKLELSSGSSEAETFDDVGYVFGLYFLYNDKFTIGPEFATIDGHNSYRLSIGLIIPSS